MSQEKELMTAQILAENLNLSVETIWKYTRDKKIPYIQLGNKQYRYRLEDVIKALSDSSVKNSGPYAVKENVAGYTLQSTRKITYQDYLTLPEEPGYRYEILDGILVKEPSPNVMHQRVSRRLQRILEDYIWEFDPAGEVFNAPLDVTFGDISVVQPDILYISSQQKHTILEARIDGPPTLVVEILSPSSSRKDRLKKLQIYQRAKVNHYWIINPEEKTVECFALRDELYTLVATGLDEDIIEHPDFKELSINLNTLWHGR